ncbi:MAG: hypothetical protein ACREBR_04745 [bacterium]
MTLFKLIRKYWAVISIVCTLLSSVITGGWYLKGKIDAQNDLINDLNQWVQGHDDDLQAQHDDLTKLKEDERLRELHLHQ